MRSLLLLIPLLTTHAIADDLAIDGSATGYVREAVRLTVKGLPKLDLSKPLQESLAWQAKFKLKVDAPEGCEVEAEPELMINFIDSSWKLRIEVVCDQPATIFLVAALDQQPLGLAIHRLTIKRRGPPPNPAVELKATINDTKADKPGPVIKVGDTVVFKYTAWNVGNVDIPDVVMLDNCGADMKGPTGDDGDGVLSIGETWSWSSKILAAEGDQQCVATIVGEGEGVTFESKTQTFYQGRDTPAPGKRFVVVIHEAQQQTPEIADLFVDVRTWIDQQGKHTIVIEDRDAVTASGRSPPPWLKPYIDKANGKPLPQVFIVTDRGEVLHQGQMTGDLADFQKLLADHGG